MYEVNYELQYGICYNNSIGGVIINDAVISY